MRVKNILFLLPFLFFFLLPSQLVVGENEEKVKGSDLIKEWKSFHSIWDKDFVFDKNEKDLFQLLDEWEAASVSTSGDQRTSFTKTSMFITVLRVMVYALLRVGVLGPLTTPLYWMLNAYSFYQFMNSDFVSNAMSAMG